jgi:hypothetical protein
MSEKIGVEKYAKKDVVIANGANVSESVHVGGGKVVGFLCGGTIANAAYSVQGSFDGTTFFDVTGMQAIAAYVSTMSSINPAYSLAAGSFVRLKGVNNETAARTFTIVYEVV